MDAKEGNGRVEDVQKLEDQRHLAGKASARSFEVFLLRCCLAYYRGRRKKAFSPGLPLPLLSATRATAFLFCLALRHTTTPLTLSFPVLSLRTLHILLHILLRRYHKVYIYINSAKAPRGFIYTTPGCPISSRASHAIKKGYEVRVLQRIRSKLTLFRLCII